MKFTRISLAFIASVTFFTASAQLSSGLVATYFFNGNAADSSGNANHGINNGGTFVADRFNNPSHAIMFTGSASVNVKVFSASAFNIPDHGALSLSLWYKGGSAAAGDFEKLFYKNNPNTATSPCDYHLALYDLNNPSFGSRYSPVVMAMVSPATATWHHVVGVYNNRKWYIYFDGVLKKSDTTSNEPIYVSNGQIEMGTSYQGALDEVYMFNRALSGSEVQQLYMLTGSLVPTTTTGIADAHEAVTDIHMYPNPASGKLNITSSRIMEEIAVYNMNGAELRRITGVNASEASVDLGSYAPGLYLVTIKGQGFARTHTIRKAD